MVWWHVLLVTLESSINCAILAFYVVIGPLNTLSCWEEKVCLNFQCLSILLFCKSLLSALSSCGVGRCLLMVVPDTIHLFISVKIPNILYSAVDFVCWEYSPFSFFNIRVCFPLFCLICIFMLRFSFCPLSYGANPCSAFLMNPSYPHCWLSDVLVFALGLTVNISHKLETVSHAQQGIFYCSPFSLMSLSILTLCIL